MKAKFKSAFDSIYAEDSLKKSTIIYIKSELQKRKKHRRASVNRLATAIVCFAVVTGAFSYKMYFTASAYVDFDVNPSIELTINRFDRVIDISSYNSEGVNILAGLSLMHKKYEPAIKDLIGAAAQSGLLQNDGLVSVTLQADNAIRESELLHNIQNEVTEAITGHHTAAQIDVFSVSTEIRSHAHEHNISPAKYLAIKELMEVDSAVTFDNYKNNSIGEIKQLTNEHNETHHSETGDSLEHEDCASNKNTPCNGACEAQNTEVRYFQVDKGHHGENDSDDHHNTGYR